MNESSSRKKLFGSIQNSCERFLCLFLVFVFFVCLFVFVFVYTVAAKNDERVDVVVVLELDMQ